jgi:hypothetical protein
MGSYFPDTAFMENNDPVRMPDSGESVGDDEGCPSF